MRLNRVILWIVLLLPATLSAQETDNAVSRSLVPVVGSIQGMKNVRWRTDVRLYNPHKKDLEVVLTLPGVAGEPFLLTTISAGQTIWFNDVVRDAFGLSEALSPLLVQTLHSQPVSVLATIQGETVEGKSVRAQPEPTIQHQSFSSRAVLHSLAYSDDQRTNVGLANLSEVSGTFTLALQRLAGRNVATQEIVVPPGSLVQLPLNLIFPSVTKGDGFVMIVDIPNSLSYAYASVLDNETHSGSFVGP
jgi:hypothetical protein